MYTDQDPQYGGNYYYYQPPGGGYDPQGHPQAPNGPPPQHGSFYPQLPTGMNLDPMLTGMAKQYGENLVGQGKEIMDQKIQKFVSVSKLKYYFAVDTAYVVKKLGLLFFPYAHKDWSVHFDKNEDDGIQPRFEVNAPDLYIPLMAFITYILVAGITLGVQQKFSPEVLGMQSSSALGWLILELMILTGSTYIIPTSLKFYDLVSFCSYKFVGMIFSLLSFLVLKKAGYYMVLGYFSLSLSVFLFRALKVQMYTVTSHEVVGGSKRRFYLLLSLTAIQPVLMWWLTYHLASW